MMLKLDESIFSRLRMILAKVKKLVLLDYVLLSIFFWKFCSSCRLLLSYIFCMKAKKVFLFEDFFYKFQKKTAHINTFTTFTKIY